MGTKPNAGGSRPRDGHVKGDGGFALAQVRKFARASREEYEALRDKDVRRLNEMGVHQYYIPQILRLFYGASANSNSHPHQG